MAGWVGGVGPAYGFGSGLSRQGKDHLPLVDTRGHGNKVTPGSTNLKARQFGIPLHTKPVARVGEGQVKFTPHAFR